MKVEEVLAVIAAAVVMVIILSGCSIVKPAAQPTVIEQMRDAGCRFKNYESRPAYTRAECYDETPQISGVY